MNRRCSGKGENERPREYMQRVFAHLDAMMDPENPDAGVECPFYDPADEPALDRIWEEVRKEKERRGRNDRSN